MFVVSFSDCCKQDLPSDHRTVDRIRDGRRQLSAALMGKVGNAKNANGKNAKNAKNARIANCPWGSTPIHGHQLELQKWAQRLKGFYRPMAGQTLRRIFVPTRTWVSNWSDTTCWKFLNLTLLSGPTVNTTELACMQASMYQPAFPSLDLFVLGKPLCDGRSSSRTTSRHTKCTEWPCVYSVPCTRACFSVAFKLFSASSKWDLSHF